MNHKLLQMLNEAGFEFTPDIMAKLPEFEKLVELEREACAKFIEDLDQSDHLAATIAAVIRARDKNAN